MGVSAGSSRSTLLSHARASTPRGIWTTSRATPERCVAGDAAAPEAASATRSRRPSRTRRRALGTHDAEPRWTRWNVSTGSEEEAAATAAARVDAGREASRREEALPRSEEASASSAETSSERRASSSAVAGPASIREPSAERGASRGASRRPRR